MSAKELFRQKYQANFDELKAEIDCWRATAIGSTTGACQEIGRQIAELDAMLLEASEKLKTLSASGTAWHDLSGGVEASWLKLEQFAKDTAQKIPI
jgi:hypothetical protein